MSKATIKLAYRQVIDASSKSSFEKNVFNASYSEFLIKSQAYNLERKYKTFSEMKAADGLANSLHYKSGFVIVHFVNGLNNKISGLCDTLEKERLFETQKFELIESHIANKNLHKVAITYLVGTFLLFWAILF